MNQKDRNRFPNATMHNQASAQRGSLAYRMTRRQSLVAAVMAPFVATRAGAAGYPDRPIRIVSPYAAGGVGETIMHLLAVSMESQLGEKIFVEAKPGAAGNVGTEEVARAAPDGSTLLIAATNNFVINQFVMKMTFDPLATLAPIAKIAEVPLVLFSNLAVPARTVQELIAYAKANPGKVNYGVPSLGTVNHLMMERLKQATGADLTCIPYRGSPPALLALLKNEIQVFPIGLAAVGTSFGDGKLTALAVATKERVPMLPDVPSIAESGFPALVASNWFGMAAPAGTPDGVLDGLAQAVFDAQRTTSVQERFTTLGMLVPTMSRQQFAASLKSEADFWHETVQRGKISIE
jgi:tripartite-type tricarboxylate transporter receptor subunit TctC